MSTFDIDAYLSGKRNSQGNVRGKVQSILDARKEKIASLNEFNNVLADNSEQNLRAQAVRDGRTWGEFGADVGLSALQGLDGLAKLPAMVYDKATEGNFYGTETQRISEMSDEREKLKSAFSQANSQQKAQIAKQAGEDAKAFVGDGALGTAAQVAAEFGSSFWEAAKDPATLPDFLAQQAAQLGVMGKVGRGVELGVKAAAAKFPTLAATKMGQIAVAKSGTAGAVGAGAVLQGTDVGSDTMQRLMSLPDEVWAQNPEYQALAEQLGADAAKQSIASDLSSKATLAAGAASLASAALPGGSAIERALVGKKGFGGAAAVPRAFAGEAGQEGIEEGSGKLFGNTAVAQIDPKQQLLEGVGAAAGQGAFYGGALGGGISAAQTGLSAVASIGSEKREKEATRSEAVKAAIESGDVSALVDPKNPVYAPDQAIAALFGNSQKEGVTPEAKQANLEQASKIVSDLEAQKAKAEEAYATVSPEGIAQYRTQLAQAQADGNTELATLLEEQIADVTKDTKAAERLQNQIARIDKQLTRAQETLTTFNQQSQPKDLDVEAEVAKITPTDPVASQDAATRIINLSMAIPERLDTGVAESLAADTSNGLSESQRAYLRTFSEARAAENQLKNMGRVSQEIYSGSKKGAPGIKYVGLTNYRANVTTALAAGNKSAADQQLGMLSRFEASHQNKAEAAAEALIAFENDGIDRRIIKGSNGLWAVEKGLWPTEKQRLMNGGLNINANTSKLVAETQIEADAISKTAAELKAAYAVKFGSGNTGGASNVQNVPQALEGIQSAETQLRSEASTQDGTTEGAATTGGGTTTDVPADATAGTDAVAPAADVAQEAPSSAASTVETAQLQSTEQTTTASEGVVPVPEAVAEAVETQGLTALQQKSPEGTPFNLRNLLADFFTQTASREGDATERPLVKVKDFLSQGAEAVIEFLANKTLSVKQQEVLQVFRTKASDWQATIQKNLARRDRKFWYADMMQFLIQEQDGKLDLDGNTKTAMSYAAFSWIAENATRSMFNTDEEINAILDRDEGALVSQEERSVLGDVGARQNLIINALGQRAVQALGLKAAKNAPRDLMPRLESALGAHIMKMLMDQKILERVTVSGAQMAALTGSSATKEGAKFQFIRLARDGNGALTEQAQQIAEASKGSQGVLDKLFSVESGLKEPSLEPIPFTQNKTRNTNQNVPEKLAKIVEAKNAEANYVRQDMWQLVTQLSEDIALGIAGVEEISGTKTHRTNALSKQAKNDGLIREFSRFMDFVKGMADIEAPMYFEHSVWKQQRVGIATNAINPQTSKIHRFMLFRKAWDTKVDVNDQAQMDNFRLRVLEGLGVKTDKQSNQKSLAGYDSVVNAPEIKAAVEVLRKTVYEGGITADEQKTLLAGVKKGGSNFHSLDALMALAHEAQAMAEGKDSFNVQMMGEVDGVTNGPMLTHLLLGAAQSVKDLFGLLNRGGFYEYKEEDAETQYNQWREKPGNLDLYETTALHMTQAVQRMLNKDGKLGVTLSAIYAFTGTLADKDGSVAKAGRNIIKTPLTAMVFGSSVKSAVDSMANNFIESIYAAIEDVSAGKTDLKTVRDNINTLLIMGRGPSVPAMSIDKLMNYEFSPEQVRALKKSFKDTLGKAVEETMTADFSVFIEQRKQFNDAAQLAFNLYDAAYTGLRDAYIDELVQAGEIAVNSKGKPIHDLTAQQESELAKRVNKLTPVMHTLMSKDSGSLAAGLYVSKSGRKLSTKSTYEGEIKFGTKFSDNGASSTSTRGFETVESAPGVAMVPMSMHSTDSAISHAAADGNEVLNIHDAHGAGLGTFEQTAKNLNQATWNAMLNYSPASEIAATLSRVVVGLGTLLKTEGMAPQVIQNLNKVLAESDLGMLLANAKNMAFTADSMRLQALGLMGSVDQYALEGGNYTVTEKDRAAAEAKRAALTEGLTAKESEALAAISEVTGQASTADAAPAVPAALKATVTSLFGAIGTPAISSDADLVEFFEGTPEATASEVIKLLNAEGRMNAINRKILGLVARVVSPDLKIRFVTSATAPDMVLEKPTTNARGWFVIKDGQEEIYVLSPEFVNSGLTAETLLHELVHAAVARVIDKPSKEAEALVAELEALRVKAQEYATANGLTQYAPALANVQEFVAWGMTNLGLQRDVLTKITMASKTGSSRLVTGMQKFISALTGLLFKKPDANIDNGLAVLVSNVSGLFFEASQVNARTETNLNLAQETVAPIDAYTTLDIHQALDNGTLEPSFKAHLANLLGGIVERLHTPYGAFPAAMRKTEAGNPLAVWLKAMETGQAPFASRIVASGFAGSAQEDFAMQQVEATVKAALNGNEALTKIAYKQLSDLYTEVKGKLKPSDFKSQADYDFVFKLESDNGDRSDYLARFAALGLANQQFNSMLKMATERDTRRFGEGQTFTERLENIFEKILAFFNEKVTKTYAGQNADEKLEALVGQLVDIEAKKRHLIKRNETRTNYLAPVEEGAKKVADAVRAKVGEVAGSAFVRNNSLAVVRAAGGLARTVANDRVELFLDGLQQLRDKEFKGRQGVVAGLITDLKGPLEHFAALLRETKRHEGERKAIITQHAKLALATFINAGKDLSKDSKASISSVFLRTGAHNLLDTMSLAEIEKLIGDPAELDKAIASVESQLTGRLKDRYVEQANALGYYKATGKSRNPVLMLNAYLIARMAGTQFKKQVTEQEAKQAEPIIASLVSLYALKYSSVQDLAQAKQVFRTENNRTDGNGVEFVLKLHKQMEAESLERLFKGNPALMIHGYTPEILNPHTAIAIADAAEGANLEAQGYSKGAQVTQDLADPDKSSKRIYVLRDGGLASYLTGVFSLTGLQAKGTKKQNGYVNVNTQAGLDNATLQAEITNAKLQTLQGRTDPRRDLSQQSGNHLVPVFNEMGDIVNWRYMMAESTKDTLLERDNRFENILGAFAGSIYDKETTQQQNLKAVEVLLEQFNAEYATRSDSYIEVGERSTDPEMRAIWNLLPDATKRDVKKVWGRNGMKVRSDALDLMFGYRKLSAAEFLRNDPETLQGLQKILREWFNTYARSRGMDEQEADNYAKRLGLALTKGERAWQELVKEAKDIIVVKTGIVMLGNIWSNISLLAMSGVPLKDMMQHHLVAMKGATAYQRDSDRLAELETVLQVGYSANDEQKIRDEIVRLKDSLARNPVRELIEAGLMPTIVEDVAAEEDIYSYKSALARKTERFTEKLNPNILAAGRFVYMSHDTKMYQSLSRITQLSDFVARYTLYQHLTTRNNNPLSQADAIQEASDAFVNYDIPMHRGIQFTDDMGFTPFTKYFLRIQRVLLKLARENPARVLMAIGLNSYMDLGPIVLDSSFTHKIGNNPLRSGAFQFPGALDDLATVSAGMALIK